MQLYENCLLSPRSYQPRKLSFGNFGSLRKKKQDESEEYVCPMDVEMPKGRSFQKGFELQIYEDDLDRLEQVSLIPLTGDFKALKTWTIASESTYVKGIYYVGGEKIKSTVFLLCALCHQCFMEGAFFIFYFFFTKYLLRRSVWSA